jgi:tetratricopeptide (TPR) repeat protein
MMSRVVSHTCFIFPITILCSFALSDAASGNDNNSQLPASAVAQVQRLDSELRAHPRDLDALVARASLYAKWGQNQLALSDFDKAIELVTLKGASESRRYPEMLARRAEFLETLKQYQLAARDIKAFLSTSPKMASRYSQAARIFLEAGQYQDSLNCINTYISVTQLHSAAYANRAISLAFLNSEAEAAADLADVLRLKLKVQDKDPAPKFNSPCTQPIIDMCVSRAAKASRATPKKPSALFGKAVVEAIAGQFEQAVADSTASLTLSPAFYEALIVRGLSHLALNQNDEALKDINHAIQLRPARELAYKVLESYYLTISGVDELLADLHRRELAQSGNLTLLMAEAHGQKVARNVDKERALYERILKQDPKFAPALFARGELSQGLGDLHSAVQYFSGGLLQDPSNLNGLKSRAACLLELGDYARALVDLDKVIKICGDPNAYSARERCYNKVRSKNSTGKSPN